VPAFGQLVVGCGSPLSPYGAYEVDTQSGEATPLWSGFSPTNGLAVDNTARRVYTSVLFTLGYWDFYTATQHSLGPVQGSGGVNCLTVANGQLYGFTSGSSPAGSFNQFIRIDTLTMTATAVLSLPLYWYFDGLAFDAQRQLFYGITTATQQEPAGLYSIDVLGSGAVTLLAPMPGPLVARGLACGEDKLWYVTANDPLIRCFDLSLGAWSAQTLPNPLPLGSSSVGADWAGRLFVPTSYCVSKLNSLGCLPTIAYSGHSSAGSASGFSIRAQQLRNQRAAMLMYSAQGRAATPFEGGTLCLGGNVRRGPAINTQGTALPAADCSGVLDIDVNAFAAGNLGGNPIPFLSIPGTVLDCQWGARDGAGAFATSLSNALESTVEV
jgi:hypothetical protein